LLGERVLNRFLIEERLGAGGYGTVYRAWDERLERPVAVKVIEAGRGGPRVLREAQAVARLNHPSVVTLYELGEDGGRTYLVSELVEGSSLRDLLEAGELTDRDVAGIGLDLCEALEHAHGRGVVHRDIKPENVLHAAHGGRRSFWDARQPGRALLTDFGTASIRGAEALTRTGAVIGTLAYMAPEQADGCGAGPEADVYALGLALFECWTGSNPVVRSSPAETARAIGAPLPSLAALRPDLPAGLCHALDACLVAEPAERPDLAELRDELRESEPDLDASRRLPSPRPERRREAARDLGPALRAAVLLALVAAVVALATGLRMPGAALALAVLALPLPLFLERAREWPAPALVPLLAPLGLAPAFPAIAGLIRGTGRAAATAVIGFAWLVATQAALGAAEPLARVDPAPPGWERSAVEATSALLGPLLVPEQLAAAAAWGLAAAALALVLRARLAVARLLGVLAWAATVVALERALPGWTAEPVVAATLALAAISGAAAWARSGRRPGLRARLGGERPPSVPAGSLP
jgi:hypothetical protein